MLAAGSSTFNPGISEKQGGVTHIQATDRLGTLKGTTNSSQTVTSTRAYDAFGNLTSSSGISTLKGFAADWGYQEEENGYKQVGHSLYDPATGRILTRDPIGSGLNWYRYRANNPVNAVDPTGLKSLFKWLVTGDADSDEKIYEIGLAMLDHSSCKWWEHFVDNNRKFWGPYSHLQGSEQFLLGQ